ncbi:MAG TPA: hypothetical protein VL966_01385, partial [Alphaproteobacteria bacterium]|nr:hypothetical protein [Alphaproteobacteria bacterium]
MARTKSKPAKRKPAKSATKKVVKTAARKVAAKSGNGKAPAPVKKTASFVTLFGMKIEVERRGKGRPIVV